MFKVFCTTSNNYIPKSKLEKLKLQSKVRLHNNSITKNIDEFEKNIKLNNCKIEMYNIQLSKLKTKEERLQNKIKEYNLTILNNKNGDFSKYSEYANESSDLIHENSQIYLQQHRINKNIMTLNDENNKYYQEIESLKSQLKKQKEDENIKISQDIQELQSESNKLMQQLNSQLEQ